MWNEDEVKGKAGKLGGKIKETVADATDDPRLKDEAAADQTEGHVREKFGKARREVGEAVEDIGDAIKR
jgi:uncharacterized protein YjbJ (UPF0337 family)